jgi:hypothetical protein
MSQLHEQVGAQLRAMGRCAMVGTLIGLMTTQAFAAGAPISAAQPAALPETASVTSNVPAPAIDAMPTTNLPMVATNDAASESNALPEAPSVQGESASLRMPADLKAMMDDAAQANQNVQPAPSSNNKALQRPGMLVMGIAGVPLAVLGIMILSLKVGPKATGERDGLGAAFLAPGAAMAGFGFYFAFHKKNQ